MIKGDLTKETVPEIFYDLYRKKATGALIVSSDDGEEIRFFFEQGQIVFAFSTLLKHKFGQVLLRGGKISQEMIDEALKKQVKGQRFGKTLLDMEFIEPEDLVWCVKEQVRSIVLDAFHYESGQYEFKEGLEKEEDVIKLNLKMSSLMRDGISRIENPRLILKGIGNMDAEITLNTDVDEVLNGFRMTEEEEKIITQARGSVTVKEVCNSMSLPAMETCKHIYLLISSGVVEKT